MDRLSFFEIKLRCLEARRKILPDVREIAGFDETAMNAVPDSRDIVSDLLQAEDVGRLRADARKVSWILQEHPKLKLSARQRALWNIYRGNPFGRWGSAYAHEHGVTRQDISNIRRTVRRKVEAAADLARLWDGDVRWFFSKHTRGWMDAKSSQILRPIIYPRVGTTVPLAMRDATIRLLKPMMELGRRILLEEEGPRLPRGDASFNRMAIGYHLLQISALAAPREPSAATAMTALTDELHLPGVFHYIADVLRRNVSVAALEEQHGMLREAVLSGKTAEVNREDLFYYRAVPSYVLRQYIVSNGRSDIVDIDAAAFISWSYQNLLITKYATSGLWQDFNFLRVVHVLRRWGRPVASLEPASRNALRTIIQKTLHSTDVVVSREAEFLLSKLVTA